MDNPTEEAKHEQAAAMEGIYIEIPSRPITCDEFNRLRDAIWAIAEEVDNA